MWPVVGLIAVSVSAWFLYREVRGVSIEELGDSFSAIRLHHWLLSAFGAAVAYLALAGYDALALRHLQKKISPLFITLTSFTTYAISHNLGASMLSGSLIRYRAYSSKGMTAIEIGQLVAFCSFTFALGTILLSGITLAVDPELATRFVESLSPVAVRAVGLLLLLAVAAYVYGSWRGFRPLVIGPIKVFYPNLRTVLLQLIIGPLELLGAAAIIYFALPEHANPGYLTVLGIFLMSFSAALVSTAPGGLGVLELLFVKGLPEIEPSDVIAALIVFRILYLLVPLAVSMVVVIAFERNLMRRQA